MVRVWAYDWRDRRTGFVAEWDGAQWNAKSLPRQQRSSSWGSAPEHGDRRDVVWLTVLVPPASLTEGTNPETASAHGSAAPPPWGSPAVVVRVDGWRPYVYTRQAGARAERTGGPVSRSATPLAAWDELDHTTARRGLFRGVAVAPDYGASPRDAGVYEPPDLVPTVVKLLCDRDLPPVGWIDVGGEAGEAVVAAAAAAARARASVRSADPAAAPYLDHRPPLVVAAVHDLSSAAKRCSDPAPPTVHAAWDVETVCDTPVTPGETAPVPMADDPASRIYVVATVFWDGGAPWSRTERGRHPAREIEVIAWARRAGGGPSGPLPEEDAETAEWVSAVAARIRDRGQATTVTVRVVADEASLLRVWMAGLWRRGVTWLGAYNVAYDAGFVLRRAMLCGLDPFAWTPLGRSTVARPPHRTAAAGSLEPWAQGPYSGPDNNNTNGGSGDADTVRRAMAREFRDWAFAMPGIVAVDLFRIAMAHHDLRSLTSYRLGSVASFLWGEDAGKDPVTPAHIRQAGTPSRRPLTSVLADVVVYCVQDSVLVSWLMRTWTVVPDAEALATATTLPVVDIAIPRGRGQVQFITSALAALARRRGLALPGEIAFAGSCEVPSAAQPEASKPAAKPKLRGALVLDSIPGAFGLTPLPESQGRALVDQVLAADASSFDGPSPAADTCTGAPPSDPSVPRRLTGDAVVTLDFKSMYPSIIIDYNLCFSTAVGKEIWEAWLAEGSVREIVPAVAWADDGADSDDDDDDDEIDRLLRAAGQPRPTDGAAAVSLWEWKSRVAPDPAWLLCRPRFLRVEWDEAVYVFRAPLEGQGLGLMPDLVAEFLRLRRAVKAEMKGVKAEIKALGPDAPPAALATAVARLAALDVRQRAFKVAANAVYGVMGCAGYGLALGSVSPSVTAVGRSFTRTLRDVVSRSPRWRAGLRPDQAAVVAGDTDSVMVLYPAAGQERGGVATAIDAAIARGQADGDALTEVIRRLRPGPGLQPAVTELEYEDVAVTFISFKAKNYGALKAERPGEVAIEAEAGGEARGGAVSNKGFGTKRDFCGAVRRVYAQCADRLVRGDVVGAVRWWVRAAAAFASGAWDGRPSIELAKKMTKPVDEYGGGPDKTVPMHVAMIQAWGMADATAPGTFIRWVPVTPASVAAAGLASSPAAASRSKTACVAPPDAVWVDPDLGRPTRAVPRGRFGRARASSGALTFDRVAHARDQWARLLGYLFHHSAPGVVAYTVERLWGLRTRTLTSYLSAPPATAAAAGGAAGGAGKGGASSSATSLPAAPAAPSTTIAAGAAALGPVNVRGPGPGLAGGLALLAPSPGTGPGLELDLGVAERQRACAGAGDGARGASSAAAAPPPPPPPPRRQPRPRASAQVRRQFRQASIEQWLLQTSSSRPALKRERREEEETAGQSSLL